MQRVARMRTRVKTLYILQTESTSDHQNIISNTDHGANHGKT